MKKYKIECKEWVFDPYTRELEAVFRWKHWRNYKTFEGAFDALRDMRRVNSKVLIDDIIILRRFRVVYNTDYIKELLKDPIRKEMESIFTIGEHGFAPMDDKSISDLTDKIHREIYG